MLSIKLQTDDCRDKLVNTVEHLVGVGRDQTELKRSEHWDTDKIANE